MRAKRSKQYRKLMHQYEIAFNFREPYQVLLDAEFIRDAARYKMRLGQMLENTLHGKIKPMITQCCIRHLYNADVEQHEQATKEAWVAVAKEAERRRCGHHELEEPLSALECILSVLDPKGSGTNKHRYVVATQDVDVRRRLRGIAGVPLIYINRSVMILEPMGGRTEDVREQDERNKIRAGLKGRRQETGTKRKRDAEEDGESGDESQREAHAGDRPETTKAKRIRGPKGPNPLSVKRKSKVGSHTGANRTRKMESSSVDAAEKASDLAGESVEGRAKRKRKRKPQIGDGDHLSIESIVD